MHSTTWVNATYVMGRWVNAISEYWEIRKQRLRAFSLHYIPDYGQSCFMA